VWDIHGSSPTNVWFASEDGGLTRWDSLGFTPILERRSERQDMTGVWAHSPSEVWFTDG
jgi:hypothetical protein